MRKKTWMIMLFVMSLLAVIAYFLSEPCREMVTTTHSGIMDETVVKQAVSMQEAVVVAVKIFLLINVPNIMVLIYSTVHTVNQDSEKQDTKSQA